MRAIVRHSTMAYIADWWRRTPFRSFVSSVHQSLCLHPPLYLPSSCVCHASFLLPSDHLTLHSPTICPFHVLITRPWWSSATRSAEVIVLLLWPFSLSLTQPHLISSHSFIRPLRLERSVHPPCDRQFWVIAQRWCSWPFGVCYSGVNLCLSYFRCYCSPPPLSVGLSLSFFLLSHSVYPSFFQSLNSRLIQSTAVIRHYITQDFNHVLHKLLPEARRVSYHLRHRVHGFQLPTKDDRNFIHRLIYKDTILNLFWPLVGNVFLLYCKIYI